MRHGFYLMLVAFLMVGCRNTPKQIEPFYLTIDNHDYVLIEYGDKGFMAHAGNCRNNNH